MQRKTQTKIKTGQEYGVIKILAVEKEASSHNLKTWLCECGMCGNNFCYTGSQILKYQNEGCYSCRNKEKQRTRIKNAEKYNGMIFNQLQIVKFSHLNDKNTPVMVVKCLKCGNETEIPLAKIIAGQSKQCVTCARKNLDIGHDITKNSAVQGTSVLSINGNRSINKNNSTGSTGVSRLKSGKYRAYINFKRKQYHLGNYQNKEDAIDARKAAEKQIYGPFLEWYKSAYPEQWKKIESKTK